MQPADALRLAQELQLLQQPGYFHGQTMLPFLREGDLVVVVPVRWEEIRRGDVLTYRFEDKYPTRRVVAVDRRKRQLILKGDSIRGRPAYFVAAEDVLGRAVARQREGRWLRHQDWAWRWSTCRALGLEWIFGRLLPALGLLRRALRKW